MTLNRSFSTQVCVDRSKVWKVMLCGTVDIWRVYLLQSTSELRRKVLHQNRGPKITKRRPQTSGQSFISWIQRLISPFRAIFWFCFSFKLCATKKAFIHTLFDENGEEGRESSDNGEHTTAADPPNLKPHELKKIKKELKTVDLEKERKSGLWTRMRLIPWLENKKNIWKDIEEGSDSKLLTVRNLNQERCRLGKTK